MKPHLPLALLTALFAALPLVETLRAETLFASGGGLEQLTESSRFSDTGKGCYFSESYNYYQPYKGAGELYEETGSWDFMGAPLAPSVNAGSSSVSGALGGLTHDVSMCWANATANVMQYWESYYGVFYDGSNGEMPYGWNYDPELAERLGGSQSLTIYNEFYRHWFDEGGTFKWASDWYCRRVDPSKLYIKDEGTGGWWENWFGESHAYVINYYDGNSNIDSLTRNFAAALGYTAQSDGSWAQTTVGQIGYLGISSYLGGHALTCWGMELGEDNRVKAIYITNSDDLTYQMVKLYIKSVDGQYYLFSDEECMEYWNWNAANWYLDEVSYLNTPQALKDLYSEYSSATLTWTGAAAEWSEAASADHRIGYALPDSKAGWTLTMRDKSYDSYFDTNRNVRFDDSAAVTDIQTGGQLTAGAVALENSAKTYTFTAVTDKCRLTAASLTATTTGSAAFIGMEVSADILSLNGYRLTVQNGTLGSGTATLQGGASLTLENSTATFTDLLLGSGTVLTLDLSLAGDETSLITVSGNMVTEGGLTLNVRNLPTDLSELYMVICAGSYDESLWNSETVTLNGAAADQLFWRDGVLYFGSYVDKQHLYFTAHTEAPEKWRKFEGLSFTNIAYQGSGAALANTQELRLEKNGPVLFENNVAGGSGGAVLNSGTLAAEGNKSLTFRSNQAAEQGGALCNAGGSVSLTGSQAVVFESNTALSGGAVSQNGGSMAVSGNGSVLFSDNHATAAGGALENAGGTLQFSNNETLSWVGNQADGNGGALANVGGLVNIIGNGSTAFTDNRAGGLGGAVYNADGGRVIIKADAGDVVFRGNTQGGGSHTVLRAIHSQGDLHSEELSENISAGEGHSVVFYDAVRVENTAWYGQTNLNTEGSGSIVFSGRYAAEDLQRLTGSAPTAAALQDSLSSVFTGSVYLAGGTLRIEDGASVTTDSLYTADGATAVTIALSNGALHTPGNSLTFGTNKALELTGLNTLESSYIAFFDGSSLTVNLSGEHADTAALTLITPDRFDMQGCLTLNLNGTDALDGGRYKLIETTHGVLWDCSLTLNGGYAEALTWENGTLWYDADYEPIPVPSTDLVFTKTLFGSFNYSGNDSLTFTTDNARAIDENGCDPAEAVLSDNGSVSFSDISSDGNGGAIANMSIDKAAPSVVLLSGNGSLSFTNITAADDGGIISNTALNGGEARIEICDNGAVRLFSGQATAGRGGAVYNAGHLNIGGNGEITMGDNAADKDGGAVYNGADALLSVTENEGLNLVRNSSEGRGGAVANYGELHLDDNNFIVATGNSSLYGAALYNEGQLSMKGNGYIQFAGNDCVKHDGGYSDFGMGGNICNAEEGTVSIRDNGNVSLSSTYALYGGSIYNEGSIVLENNRDVNLDSNSTEGNGGGLFNIGGSFVLSHNRNVIFNEDWAWGGYGGAVCNMAGTVDINANESLSVFSSYCAFSNGNTSGSGEAVMNIIGNGDIVFYDNVAYQNKNDFKGKAGAVYNLGNGTLNICGNGDVEFHNNTVLQFAEVTATGKDCSYLHALHNEGTLNLSARSGKRIVFYDGISSAKGSVVNLNKEYTDADGKVQQGAGDIVFSGARVESTLYSNMLAEFVTPELIALSKTSTLETDVRLYGGRLVVAADACFSADALAVVAGSGGTVRVDDAELKVKGALTLQSGTKLETEGSNRITAGSVNMLSGSTLSFVVSSTNLTDSVLTLTGTLNTEKMTVSLGDTSYLEKGNTYALLTATDYKTDAWTEENITIATDSVLFEDLVWKNGTLYLNYANHAAPLTVTWDNASGDGLWNGASLNWRQKDTSAAYADEMKVEFGDKGAGKVSLAGVLSPKSVLVDSAYDYVFEGKGKLSGKMKLTKQGAGTLTIATANDYTGGTAVNGGTVVVGNAAALGSGAVAVNDAALEVAADGFANSLSFAGKSVLTVDKDHALVLSGALNNSGTLTMSGSFNASSLTLNTTAATRVDVNGNSGTSGFAKDAAYSVQLVNGGTVVNNGATVTHGTHTLTLDSNGVATTGGDVHYDTYLLTGTATATTSAIHGKSSAATITQTGGTLTVNDTATVNATGGNIALTSGTLNGTLSGATITATDGTLKATFNGSNTLNGSSYALKNVLANSGTLTMSGSFNANALTLNTTAATHVDVNGNSGTSGFAKEAAYSVQLVNGGSVVNNGATVTHGTHSLTLGSNGVATAGGTIHYDTYLLTGTATATTSAIHGKSSAATITQTGGTLTVNDTATVNATGGNIALTSGTLNGTLSGASITATDGTLKATFNGSNTLNGSSYALKNVIANSGTLTMSGSFNASSLTLNTTAATHVDVNGNSGTSGFAKETAYSVQLVNGGTVVNNGASVTHGTHSLTLGSNGVATAGGAIHYDTYLLTGTATVTTSAIHGKSSAATITQTGGTLTVDDAAVVTATGGSLVLNGGSLSGTVQTAAGSALTLKSSAALNGDLTLDGGSLVLNRNTLAVSDTLSLLSATSLDVSAYGIGSYQLLTFGELDGSLDNLSIESKRYRYALSQKNNALMLTVKALNNTLTWNAPKGVWTTGGSFGSGVFEDGDDVIFRTAAAVTITGAVEPGEMLVDSAAAVKFTANTKTPGSGIVGKGTLTKSGAGMLTLNAGNRYSGGTVLNEGTIKATAADSFGTGAITVNGGTLDLASKAVANDIVLAGSATLKGDAKYVGAITVDGNATLLAKTANKSLITIGSGNTLNLAPAATVAGSLDVGGTLNITAAKGLTVTKGNTLTLNGGTVNGLVNVAAGAQLMLNGGTLTTAPVLTGGKLVMPDAEGDILLSGTGTLALGTQSVGLKGKGELVTDAPFTVTGGKVALTALNGYDNDLDVSGGTLALGKVAVTADVNVSGSAALNNGTAHSGDVNVNGELIKGSVIKLTHFGQNVNLNQNGVMNGTISGLGMVNVNADVDASLGKMTNAYICLNSGTLTNNKGLKLAKNQMLLFNGGHLNLEGKALTTAAGTSLTVMDSATLNGALTLGGGLLVLDDGADLSVSGALTLSKSTTLIVDGTATLTFGTLAAPKKGTLEDFFGVSEGVTISRDGNTLTFSGYSVAAAAAPAAAEPETVAAPAPALAPAVAALAAEAAAARPLGDALVMADWGIVDANRAFTGTLQSRRDSGVLLADGQGMAWASAMGGVSRHGSENSHNGADVNLNGAAVGVEHTAGANSTLGLAVGHTWSRIGATGMQHLRQDTAHVALYGQTKLPHGFTAEWSAAYGDTDSKGTFYGTRETWSQKSTALSARLNKTHELSDATSVRGFAGLNYDATDAASIHGMHTGSIQRLQGEVGAGITHRADKLTTYAEASVTTDLARNAPAVDFGAWRQGGATPGRTGLNLTLGAAYELTDKWSINAAYHVEAAERATQHSFNVGAGMKF